MKNIYTIALVLLCAFVGKAQIINFPDAAFKAKLLAADTSNYIASTQTPVYDPSNQYWYVSSYTKIDANNDGEIQVSEALSIKYLNASGTAWLTGNIASMVGIESFVNLLFLSCDYNVITTLNVSGLSNLKYFGCSQNQLTSLNVDNLTNLQGLSCGFNLLFNLNTSNLANLKYLDYTQNQIQNIDFSMLPNLQSLFCGFNQISSLNVSSLTNLEQLNYSGNQLPNLNINSLTNLQYLYCGNVQLSSINVSGLTNLKYLDCSGNQLTSLNVDGLNNLQDLVFSFNQISSINFGSIPISRLICNHNLLTSINVSNLGNLMQFECNNNQLTNLDVNGLTQLSVLDCSNNQISNLNINGTTYLQALGCNNNQLTTLMIKNGILNVINFSDNPNLQYICADEGKIPDVQNQITQYGYTNCHVNSYCSFTPGGTFYTIQGNNHYDENNNGCDANDINFPNLKLSFTDGTNTGNLIPDSSGNYHYDVQAGTQTITPILENPSYFNVSPASATVTFPTTASPFVQDFCVTANGSHPDLEIVLIPITRARPGFDAVYKLVYKNKGTNTQSGSVNFSFNDAVLDLVSANPAASTQVLNTLSWNFSNLHPFETREIVFTLNVNSPMETPPVNSGYLLNYSATVSSSTTDETPSDNTFAYNQTVVNALDPNEKVCLEGSTVAPEKVGDFVHYLIRFENDGTANAQNIVVKDMIDTTKFDIATLIPESGSATYTTRISNTNQVEFVFQNINLPFAAGTNTGYVAFKIKTKSTLLTGNTFSNTASIYFDYNFPIITNTATTTIQALATQDFEFSTYFTLFPNPAKSVLNISTKSTIEVHSLTIYNLLGQVILAIPNAQNLNAVDVSSLKTGNYFLKITSDKGSATEKFMKSN